MCVAIAFLEQATKHTLSSHDLVTSKSQASKRYLPVELVGCRLILYLHIVCQVDDYCQLN